MHKDVFYYFKSSSIQLHFQTKQSLSSTMEEKRKEGRSRWMDGWIDGCGDERMKERKNE